MTIPMLPTAKLARECNFDRSIISTAYFWVPDVEPCKLDPNSGRYCVSQKTRSVTLDCYAKRGPGDFVKVSPGPVAR